MTFSFFKTVFVSNRFSFFVSELPMEIATRVPDLRRARNRDATIAPRHARCDRLYCEKKVEAGVIASAATRRDGRRRRRISIRSA
jgi:hypothetical protein